MIVAGDVLLVEAAVINETKGDSKNIFVIPFFSVY